MSSLKICLLIVGLVVIFAFSVQGLPINEDDGVNILPAKAESESRSQDHVGKKETKHFFGGAPYYGGGGWGYDYYYY